MCGLTDMINGTGTKLPVELLGPEAPEVLDSEGPEVEHVVPREGIPLLQQNHLGPQEAQLDGRPQATWPSPDNQTLGRGKVIINNAFVLGYLKRLSEQPRSHYIQ